jgi:hypothetical protein
VRPLTVVPVPFIPPPRTIADWDELGFPLLAYGCPDPECGASALILNEWDAIECLTCSWRQFTHDAPSADYGKWPDEDRIPPDESPLGLAALAHDQHHQSCGHCSDPRRSPDTCAEHNRLAAAWRAIKYPHLDGAKPRRVKS